MKIGDVFIFVGTRVRVIMFDDKEVFYRVVNNRNNFYDAKHKTLIYSRITRDYFDNNSSFIESFELTENELDVHKPELPLRLNCFTGSFWSDKPFKKESTFYSFLKSSEIQENALEGLCTEKVVIFPNSQLMSNKKPVLIENRDGSFPGPELIKACFEIQSVYVKPDKPYFSRLRKDKQGLSGIGMYRLGIKGNIPSYYLGGEVSMMEWHIIDYNNK